MIFVTVGTDLPFNRMVKTIDEWAEENDRHDIFAQIGDGAWEPKHIRFSALLEPPEFTRLFKSASVIVSHAGMGTILSALHYGKPILVMPKRGSLGEHRSEHQVATARRMMELGNVNVAFDEDELRLRLDHLDHLVPSKRIESHAGSSLIAGLRNFIFIE